MKKKIIILFICFSTLFYFKTENVMADNLWGSSSNPGISFTSGTGSGGGYRHRIIASGYRVSLVDNLGNVIKYNGSNTNSVDYWPESDNISNGTACVQGFKYLTSSCTLRNTHLKQTLNIKYYSTKRPKTKLSGRPTTSNTLSIDTQNKYDFITKDVLYNVQGDFGCGVTDKISNTAISSGGGDTCYNNNYSKFSLQAMSTLVLREEHIDDDYNKIGRLLYYGGYGTDLVENSDNITTEEFKKIISHASNDGVFLIVEPVIAISRPNATDTDVSTTSPIYLGTPAELVKMGFFNNNGYGWSYSRFSYLNPIIYAYGTGKVAGINLSKEPPIATPDNAKDPSNPLGVYIFEIGLTFGGNTCKELVTGLIDDGKLTDSNIDGLEDVDDAAKKWLKDYKSYGLDQNSLKKYLAGNNKEACPEPECGELLNLLGKNENSLKILSEKFKGFDFLDPTFLIDVMGLTYNDAKCDKAPNCPVDQTELKCKNKNSLKLKDTSSLSCLSQGIAYNGITNSDGTFTKESTQTSFDKEYGNPGYCSEDVTFNFPGNASTKAGKLLKWGIVSDIADNTFGTMTVHRTCFLTDKNQALITSNWADVIGKNTENTSLNTNQRINPQFNLYYKQAIPSDINGTVENDIVQAQLKVYLSEFEMVDNKKFDECNDVKYDITGNVTYKPDGCDGNNPRTISCSGGCGNSKGISSVEMTATYQIYYDKDLYWYSDKSDQFAFKKLEGLDTIENHPSYVAVGYGLPTSFVTPTTLKGKEFGYSLDSDSSSGRLSISVSHVGTKNENNDSYHFDNMIEFALDDDDPEPNSTIDYSCGFSIENRLFDNEHICEDERPDCGRTCDPTSPSGCDNECPNGVCESPKGIDVVFRTVDLISSEADINIAFPGRSGNGRERGRNWAEIADSDVAQILRNDVYSNDPMYELTLDAGTIQRIREYNRQLTYPYTDMAEEDENYGSEGNGYEGYTFYKDDSTGQTTVASNFIKYLIDSEKITGRCAIVSNNDRIKSIITGCGRDD